MSVQTDRVFTRQYQRAAGIDNTLSRERYTHKRSRYQLRRLPGRAFTSESLAPTPLSNRRGQAARQPRADHGVDEDRSWMRTVLGQRSVVPLPF